MTLTLRSVSVFSACCTYCDDEVVYTVADDQMPAFSKIDGAGDHRSICSNCDFYRQEDLLAAFRQPSRLHPARETDH